MHIPVSWLKDFVEIDQPIEWIAERLTLAGLEVGSIRYVGVPQNTVEGIRWPASDHLVWDREKLLLGAIREVRAHPDADRLVLAMVDYGGAELEQCVTGAPNLYEYKGQGPLDPPLWTAFALEGAQVFDGHSEEQKLMTLKGRNLRGVFNKSMVCSEKELGISDEHEGVILMEHDPAYVAGTPLQDVLGDVVLEVELTPNLGHNFSVLGVAREIAALTGKDLHEPDYNVIATGAPISGQAALDIREASLNPRFCLTLLRDTTVKPAPYRVQYRLRLAGQRPINNIVDATNYITFEIGQPLHAYDYDKLVKRAGGQTPTLITRLPAPGETLSTLDGETRQLGPQAILVCDTAGVIGLGGIMGGADTEIDDATTNVLLEAANWHFINIRKTQQAQKLFTEAGTRFSRNIHPSRAPLGCARGIELMRRWGGGDIAQGMIDDYPQPPAPVEVTISAQRIRHLLGLAVPVQEAADILTRLQFAVTLSGDDLQVIVPDYRTDIGTGLTGQADLIEELARIIGYDRIPATILADELPEQRTDRAFTTEERIRDLLVALGLRENISYRFTTPEAEALLVPPGAASSLPQAGYVRLLNPIASDKTVLRHTLLTNLLESAVRNNRFVARQQIFEIGAVFLASDNPLPEEPGRIGILMTGPRQPGTWQGGDNELLDFFDLKGIVEGLLGGLHIAGATFQRGTHTSLHPGRSAQVVLKKRVIGHLGELHPQVALAFRLTDAPILVAELDLEALIDLAPERHEVVPLPITPAIIEDLALVVKEDVEAAEVEALIRRAGGDLLTQVKLFDVYRGPSIPEGTKSLAYTLTYQTDERTLKDKDVVKVRQRIVAIAERELSAKLRA